MQESRWLRWIGPGVMALVAIGSVASSTLGAGGRPWAARACGNDGGGAALAVRFAGQLALADLRQATWFRLDPALDRGGALVGQRLAVGIDGNRSRRTMDLPPESFAAGPFGRVVLVGTDDGSISRLEAVEVSAGCSWAIGEESVVIRRATIDPAGEWIYEMRVDRETRADLGIWKRRLDGTAAATRILDPLESDERFGPTFTTEFTWDVAGRRLAVQSCGEAACRTRVIDPANGALRTVAEPDLGALIGLDADALVSYAACPGFPCPIVATTLETGARTVLADAAAVAVVIATPDGPRLVHEVFLESGVALRAVALDGSAATELGALSGDLRLHASPANAGAATSIPSGWVLLATEGKLSPSGPDARTQLRHVPDGTTVQLDEVTR